MATTLSGAGDRVVILDDMISGRSGGENSTLLYGGADLFETALTHMTDIPRAHKHSECNLQ